MIKRYFFVLFLTSLGFARPAQAMQCSYRLENNTSITVTEIKNLNDPYFSVELTNAAGQLIGNLMFQLKKEMGDQCFISYLTIEPPHRRQGHATALLESLFLRFKRLDKKTVALFVDQDNKKAQGLYSKLGFIAEGNFDSLIVLKKDLNSIKEIRELS